MSDALRSGFDIGGPVLARGREFARSAGLPDHATRAQLISALSRRRVIVPAMPEGFDDTGDLEHALRQLPAEGLLAPAKPGWRAVVPTLPSRQPRYTIRVRAVLCSDSTGKNAANISDAALTQLVANLSNVYYTAGLTFTHTKTVVADTTLNQDYTLPSGADMTATAKPITDEQATASFKEHNAARSNWARRNHTGELVVFFRYGTSVSWNDTAKTWELGPATHAFSGGEHEFVAMNQGTELLLMAHEMGHYFHLPHTHSEAARLNKEEQALYPDPDNDPADHEGRRKLVREKAIEAIRKYVDDKGHPAELGLNVFDGDKLSDTAPDPSGQIFHYEFKDSCTPKSITLDVLLKTGVRPYTLDPDRDLIMSYFFRCPGGKRFSEQQIDRIRQSLETKSAMPTGLSRNHLIAPKSQSSRLGFLTQWLPWRKPSPVPQRG
jgi:hypothetical protein